MQFYEYSLSPQANSKPPSLVAMTTASLYGANPDPNAHTVLPPKRYLPENKKKQGPGNSMKVSQVNAAPVRHYTSSPPPPLFLSPQLLASSPPYLICNVCVHRLAPAVMWQRFKLRAR